MRLGWLRFLFDRFFTLEKNSDIPILISALILVGFGTVMIISIQNGTGAESAALGLDNVDLSRYESLKKGLVTASVFSTLFKQFIFIALGYFIICSLSHFFSYDLWKIWGLNITIIALLLLASTLVIGREISGSRAWISLAGFFFQPSELCKPLTIVNYAYAMYRIHKHRHTSLTFSQVFLWPMVFTVLTLLLVAAEKDFGTLIIIFGITLVCVLVPSMKTFRKVQRRLVLLVFSVAMAGSVLLVFSEFTSSLFGQVPFLSHIAIRIENMKNPYEDIYGDGYQPANSLYGIGDAGLFGKGLGNSIRKYGYLTQSESDYILAVIIEETGIIGLSVLIICNFIIIYRLFKYALRSHLEADRILFMATASYILLHFLINVGGVGGLIPMTGVPLLFISSGGSSLMAVCIALGICENRIAAMNREKIK